MNDALSVNVNTKVDTYRTLTLYAMAPIQF